jgi:hypothetical protein
MASLSISNIIVSKLEKGSVSKQDLIEYVCKKKDVTVQGVYKEIRKLVTNGTLLIHKRALSLNLLYISKQYDRWSSVLRNYEGGLSLKNHFLDLQEGESLTYRFRTLNDLDAYWVHASIILDKHVNQSVPSYSIIPHDWFFYGRKETDVFWTKSQKSKMRLILTHPTLLDKEVAKERRAAGYKMTVGANPLKQDESTYYTLIHGYIFKITLKAKASQQIKKLLDAHSRIGSINTEKLHQLIYGSGEAVMKISRDMNKFNKLASKCKKYFE